jgi:hypothetical protein
LKISVYFWQEAGALASMREKMPPLATEVVDSAGVAAVQAWMAPAARRLRARAGAGARARRAL